MKKYSLIPALMVLFACNQEQSTELSLLKEKRDSLREVASEVTAQIKELDALILSLDTAKEDQSVSVETGKLERSRFEHFFTAQGSVETQQNVSINPEFGGSVDDIRVEVGQQVSKGQALLIINTDVLRKNIEELKSNIELATSLFKKQESLWNQKIGSEVQYLDAKTRKESLEKRLAALNEQVAMATINAPFDGVVDEVFIKKGEVANPMFPVIRLVNLRDVYVVSDIPEDYLKSVKTGTPVKVNFPSTEKEISAVVSRIGQHINPNNRTFRVQVDVKNDEGALKPNLLGVLNIMDYAKDSSVVVPSDLIQHDASGREFVFLALESDKGWLAVKAFVKSGLAYNSKTEILEGLTGDETLVLTGARSIKEGQLIKF